MSRRIIGSLVGALAAPLLAAGLVGCGLVKDAGGNEARVLVTRDFGARVLGARIARGDVVPRVDGRAGGRTRDWFLYVNGVEREVGAADVQLHDGDHVWWDRHDAGASPHVPAVVGSFPEPFAHGADGKRFPVVLECADDAGAACTTVSERLGAAGVVAGRQVLGTGVGEKTVRVLVGPWSELRGDPALEQLDHGPVASGVYARFSADGRRIDLLDPRAQAVRTLGAGAGLVAATRFEQQAPTWTVTGTDAAGVASAARALDERTLQRRFALALDGSHAIGLPVVRTP